MKHELKIWPEFFNAIERGDKTFEIREITEVRDFVIGDLLILRCWIPGYEYYDGRELKRIVSYILRGPMFGIQSNYAVLGLKEPR